MELTPERNMEYANRAYWERRFETEEGYEWFGNYRQFRHLLNPHLQSIDQILVLGCGTSSLPTDLVSDGFRNVLATDISQTLIERLQDKASEGVVYQVADMFELPFADKSFDVVIEKGAIDVIFTESKSAWKPPEEVCKKMESACKEIFRVLKNKGRFFSITFTQPHFRQRFFDGHPWKCNVESFGEEGAFKYFVYRLKKSQNCPLLRSPKMEQQEYRESASMHEYMDQETFLFNINL